MSHTDSSRLDRWIAAARSTAAKKAYTLASLVFALSAAGYSLRPNPRYLPSGVTTGVLVAGAVFYTGLRAWACGAHHHVPGILRGIASAGRGVTSRLSGEDLSAARSCLLAGMLILGAASGVVTLGPLPAVDKSSAATVGFEEDFEDQSSNFSSGDIVSTSYADSYSLEAGKDSYHKPTQGNIDTQDFTVTGRFKTVDRKVFFNIEDSTVVNGGSKRITLTIDSEAYPGQNELYVAGSTAELGSVPRSPNGWMDFKLKGDGDTIKVKIWAAGESEPSSWTATQQHSLTRSNTTLIADNSDMRLDSISVNADKLGETVSGRTLTEEGDRISDASLKLLDSTGSVVSTTTSNDTGYYEFGAVSDGSDYQIRASASGYQNKTSGSFDVAGAPKNVDLTLYQENSYEQVLILSDETGKFEPSESSVITFRHTGDGVPTAGPFYDESSWTWVDTSSFNWKNTTSQRLKEGEIYAFAVTDGSTRRFNPAGTLYEFVGFYGGSGDNPKYLRIKNQSENNEVVAAETDDGVTVSYEGNDTNTSLDDVEFDIPDNEGGTNYQGGADFEDPSGDYESTVSDDLLRNLTDDQSTAVPEVDYNGTTADGEVLNGSTDVFDTFPGFSSSGNESAVGGFGPTGGSGGGASTGQQLGGLAIIAGGAYLAYRRFGDGSITESIPGLGGR